MQWCQFFFNVERTLRFLKKILKYLKDLPIKIF